MDGGNCGRDPTNQPPIGFAKQVPRSKSEGLQLLTINTKYYEKCNVNFTRLNYHESLIR
jgi:hypothetical protein